MLNTHERELRLTREKMQWLEQLKKVRIANIELTNQQMNMSVLFNQTTTCMSSLVEINSSFSLSIIPDTILPKLCRLHPHYGQLYPAQNHNVTPFQMWGGGHPRVLPSVIPPYAGLQIYHRPVCQYYILC